MSSNHTDMSHGLAAFLSARDLGESARTWGSSNMQKPFIHSTIPFRFPYNPCFVGTYSSGSDLMTWLPKQLPSHSSIFRRPSFHILLHHFTWLWTFQFESFPSNILINMLSRGQVNPVNSIIRVPTQKNRPFRNTKMTFLAIYNSC